ncbi:MAG TPA: MAPEG family protein [Polyangiaceae bacterium]|jgi:uncharacterized MAPEG superfamily protein|nr:MAPEG family protein [Polyangiaceae bacterium]
MLTDVQALVYSTYLTLAMLLTASVLRARAWAPPGLVIALGNRDDVPPPTALAARADRAGKNMLEGLLLFVAAVAAARYAGVTQEKVELGATLFFWARVVYFGVYLAGIPYLRTAVWAVATVGTFMIARAAL